MSKHISSTISQYFGAFASKEFSPFFQSFVNKSYVSLMGLDMSEFSQPSSYKSLNALFTRSLKTDREFSLNAREMISPCDSFITECGQIQSDQALQIKGMNYSVNDFLGDKIGDESKKKLINGQFVNFYLSPRDYHRYHIPTNLKILRAVHIPGKLYPVNIPYLKKQVDLFIENERVVIECELPSKKPLFMVLVGALNVGKMSLSFEPNLQTNVDNKEVTTFEYDELYMNKGDEFGYFEMGSTIIMFSEEGTLELNIQAGEKVSFSQKVATLF
ncbi:MAG: phosphatidylserine decarboxylase [Campylobacterota bacterium]|nr:phosphatidylserine decarboxylase [Campylobacterota bacterium]